MKYDPPADAALHHFLSHLPMTGDVQEWMNQFKTALCELLPDVDRVSLIINFYYDLREVDRAQISLIAEEVKDRRCVIQARPGNPVVEAMPSDGVTYFREAGYPVDQYHSPSVLTFLVDGEAPLAAIYLWRSVMSPMISTETPRYVVSLTPLLVSLFYGVVAQHYLEYPQEKAFIRSLNRMVEETSMTVKQNRIAIQLLHGYSQKEIASRAGVSIDAVKDTIRRLYRRAGVTTYAELYAKYFVPDIGDGFDEFRRGTRDEFWKSGPLHFSVVALSIASTVSSSYI